ncbi:MAG: hypothetical protein H0W72_16810, partial [Planctomycetes bacterium]|nr:hypothetical protein [Planctomycetota bacterium]
MKVPVRIIVVGLLGIGTFAGSGCLGTAVQAVVAPQSLATGAANQLASTTTGAVARALGPPSTYDQTVEDLDRIIADNGEAENIDVLRALRA